MEKAGCTIKMNGIGLMRHANKWYYFADDGSMIKG